MKKIIQISRPRFWIYLFGPYLVGLAAGGRDSDILTNGVLIMGFYFLFPANFFLYGVNDIFDYATDRLNPKKKYYEELVTPKEQKKLFQIILLTSLPFFLYSVFISIEVATLFSLFILLSLQYSSPPIRAKSKPFLDMAFNGLYIVPGILSYFLLTQVYPPLLVIIAGLLWTMAMHAYSAVPDITSDKKGKIATVATILGFSPTLYLCFFLYVLSAILMFPYLGIVSILLGLIYVTLIAITLMSNEENIMTIYKKFPLINTITGAILFFFILFK